MIIIMICRTLSLELILPWGSFSSYSFYGNKRPWKHSLDSWEFDSLRYWAKMEKTNYFIDHHSKLSSFFPGEKKKVSSYMNCKQSKHYAYIQKRHTYIVASSCLDFGWLLCPTQWVRVGAWCSMSMATNHWLIVH